MATPTWNQIAAPNFGAGNYLIAQAMEQLSKATTGFKSIADQYKDTVQKRNLGLIQEYVNSAKTPEELQSESFKQRYANLVSSFKGEVDPLKASGYLDGRIDSLTKRAADQTSVEANQFKLAQDKINAPIQTDLFRTQLGNAEEALRFAQANNPNVIAKNKVDADVALATQGDLIRKAALDVKDTESRINDRDRTYDLNKYKAETERQQIAAAAAKAEAERRAKELEKNPALTLLSGIDKIDSDYNSELLKPSGDPKVADSLETWWDAKNTWWRSDTDLDNIKAILSTDPKTAKLPGKMQVAIADIAYTTIMNENTLGRNTFSIGSAREQAEEAVKAAFDKVETQKNDYLYSQKVPFYRKAVRDQMLQTGERDPVKAASQVGMDEYEMYRTNIRTPLQNMAESVYESSGSKLPKEQFVDKFIYRSVNKEPVDDLIKPKQEAALRQFANGTVNGKGGRNKNTRVKPNLVSSSVITDTTQNPDALAAQEQRMQAEALKRSQEAGTTTLKTKPVADPLRQAASEQTPVATSNTAQPRPLTPTEAAQGERMQQAALSRLIGAKLEEKRAEVQKQFPGTPLKQIAKAATPVPSPLIPTESQNAYKVKENNLTLDFRTGKSTPTKDPVPMPKVTWKEPVQAVAINPIYAQLPQHKVVATFVPDGDTFNATSDSYKTKGERARKAGGIICRIDSIETPETAKPQYGKKGQPYGEEAAKILQQMVLNKEISIRVTKPTDGESNYGRDICQIEVAGKDVSVELIREGAAWVYKEYNHYGQGGLDLESNARQSKLGLWGLPNPVYPPDFRHNGYQNP